jgi:uncharacterized membrane protein
MISVVAVVLGLTVVALQVASGQYSPRLLGNFLRDRHTQIVLSVFVATFAYSTAGLYTVGISGGGRVEEFPRLAVTGAIILLFASLGFLIYFIDHLAHSIQLDTIMDVVQQNTSLMIAHLPDTGETGALAVPAQAVPILAWRSGYIQSVHPEDLYEAAKAAEVVINLVPRVGDHIVENMPIAWWWADESALAGARFTERLGEHLIAAVLVGGERTLLQDAAFGRRQLVDIALKALSPAINDPYTAVMSVERLTALLAALAPRRLGDIVLHDPDGPSRVVARFPTFADYVDLAIGQIRRYGASEPQVAYALLRLLRVAGAQTRDNNRRQVLASHARLVLADAGRTICQPADLAPLQSGARPYSRHWQAKKARDLRLGESVSLGSCRLVKPLQRAFAHAEQQTRNRSGNLRPSFRVPKGGRLGEGASTKLTRRLTRRILSPKEIAQQSRAH